MATRAKLKVLAVDANVCPMPGGTRVGDNVEMLVPTERAALFRDLLDAMEFGYRRRLRLN